MEKSAFDDAGVVVEEDLSEHRSSCRFRIWNGQVRLFVADRPERLCFGGFLPEKGELFRMQLLEDGSFTGIGIPAQAADKTVSDHGSDIAGVFCVQLFAENAGGFDVLGAIE